MKSSSERKAKMKGTRGFTLIELLIVVAIISILASIAIPQYYEAVVRAKVARTLEDMGTVKRLLAAYNLDEDDYPLDDASNPSYALFVLTTPVAYAQSVPADIFRIESDSLYDGTFFYARDEGDYDSLLEQAAEDHQIPTYLYGISSYGPDTVFSHGGVPDTFPYDASNGTISWGNIWAFGP
jgi:prepilin-type N-terminal cleavage/methylation domain-containing protein